MPKQFTNLNQFQTLIEVIQTLRGPNGCPWDQKQNHETLAPYAIEEMYEMIDALLSKDDQDFCEELGDVLFQVVLHAELASERNAFNIEHVIQSITEKVIRRHPHVFSNVKVNSAEDVIKNWEMIKKQEKENKNKPQQLFKHPKALPALDTAQEIGQKTNKINFDWEKTHQVIEQLKLEIAELEEVLEQENSKQEDLEHELGDILFSTAQLARHLNLNAEISLRKTNLRFEKRMNYMLEKCDQNIDTFTHLSAKEKEHLWSLSKKNEKQINS